MADAGEHIHFGLDRNIFGAVVELSQRLQAQQISALDINFHIVGNAELSKNLAKAPALDRDFAESGAEMLVALGRIAPDAAPDVVVAFKKTDRPRSFRDRNIQQREASGFDVVSKLLATCFAKSRMRFDSYDFESLGQIKCGVFPVMESHIVDQITLHGASQLFSVPRNILCENQRNHGA